jgi:hypothetical protein
LMTFKAILRPKKARRLSVNGRKKIARLHLLYIKSAIAKNYVHFFVFAG